MASHTDAPDSAGGSSSRPPIQAVGANPFELGKRLQHARKRAKRTQQDAADFVGVARTTITAVEKGERRVQPDELAKLATLYNARLDELLRPGEPDEAFGVQLRAAVAPHETSVEDLEAVTFEFQQLCEDYLELERLTGASLLRNYPAEVSLPTNDVEQRAEALANAERNRLGLGDGPVGDVSNLLEQDVGLRVFYLPMPSKVAAMFGYTERLGGCIAVNAKHPEPRRRQSAMHEYAHFLTSRHRAEVAVQGHFERSPAHERFANAFARTFLMSASGLSRRFVDLKQSKKQITVADLCTLAHFYFVSVESLIRRLEELRLISMGNWDRLRDQEFRVREAQQLLGLVERTGRTNLLPVRYLFLAVHSYKTGELTEGRFARFLRVDRVEARRLLQEISGGGTRDVDPNESRGGSSAKTELDKDVEDTDSHGGWQGAPE
jgi:Zn-dependent peptidase ImmA (M78 family)/transcriptional regulator with XRE-family HTH domain